MALTISPSMWTGDGSRLPLPTTENTVQYLVHGLRENHFALIGHTPNTQPVRWRFLYQPSPDVLANWQGDYATPEEALAALSKDFPDA